ncbi:heterokaryon incompatibility protein-domain-containing protein [Bisporella sp. PMI_857]|nr:heterokaryon incompatibility protein-domain-containing protein [Bisporella sp. PMI_857]
MACKNPSTPEYYSCLRDNQIRILRLQPGRPGDSVVVQIWPEILTEKSEYRALSWRWGSNTANEPIHVGKEDTPQTWPMRVRHNLLGALKRLRENDKEVRLWVDAICIQQSDGQEKGDQIQKMPKIYGMAQAVCVWLGDEGDDSLSNDDAKIATDFIRELASLKDSYDIVVLERYILDAASVGQLDPLIKLLKQEWFTRRWVVQLGDCIGRARSATVYCGRYSVSWTELADAITLLERVGRDSRILKKLPRTNHASVYLDNFSSLPAYRLVQNTTGMFRGPDEWWPRTWRYTLEELVSFLTAFTASRLHDTIYAVLGLASNIGVGHRSALGSTSNESDRKRSLLGRGTTLHLRERTKAFNIDYDLCPLNVFVEFLKFAIEESQSLDIICRPWAPESGIDADNNPQTIELPSWILNISRKPFLPTRHGNMVRYNPDPLVGPAIFRHRFYHASGRTEPKYRFTNREGAYSWRMVVEGFELGKIGRTWRSGEFGNIPADWLIDGGWKKESDLPPDRLWRTLVADRNAQGGDPDHWYPAVFQEAVKERGIRYGFKTHTLINETHNPAISELFRRVQAVVWNRRLIVVKGGFKHWLIGESSVEKEGPETLGLAPNGARENDIICIIYGCSVPLVLRQEHGEKAFIVIGECYVDHMMDGEAIRYCEDQIVKEDYFELK